MHNSKDMIAHTTAFDTPVVEHWLEREVARLYGVRHMVKDYLYSERGNFPISSMGSVIHTIPYTA